jgi:glutaredoxin
MSAALPPVRVVIVGKPGCHLCDVAREVVDIVCAETDTEWAEVSIADDPELADQYWDLVPVVLVDGVQHDVYRVDSARLRATLTAG